MRIEAFIFLSYLARPISGVFYLIPWLRLSKVPRYASVRYTWLLGLYILTLAIGSHVFFDPTFEQLRFYWSWLYFFILLHPFNLGLNNLLLFRFIAIFTALEFTLTNAFSITDLLRIYGETDYEPTKFFNCCSRSYGFSLNATVTSVIALSLYYSIEEFKKTFLDHICLFIQLVFSFSLTGLGIFIVISLIRGNKWFYILVMFLIFAFVILQGNYENSSYRFSLEYLTIVYDIKFNQFSQGINDVGWMPQAVTLVLDGDFSMLDFLRLYGLVMSMLALTFIVYGSIGKFFIPILVLLLGSLHYHVIFSFPGAIVLGYFLSHNYRSFRR